MDILRRQDPQLWEALEGERRRQRDGLELIASENYTSPAVLAALGTELTNKYAEGYPGRRYYGGCEFVDQIEQLAIDRAKQLFTAEHANVQPHAGSQANMAVYFACLEPGDTILAMNLAHGGHLTHGSPVNFSGKIYRVVPYGVTEGDHRIDYDQVASLAREHKPKLVLAGHSSYPRHIDFARFAEIAREVRAVFVVDMAHFAGLVAGGSHPSPVPHADFVTSTTHKTLRGPRSGFVLCRRDISLRLAERFIAKPTEGKKKQEDQAGYWARKLDSAVFPGMQGGPLVHTIAAKAVCFREAAEPSFKQYAAQVVANAKALADELARAGFRLMSGGTDNHLMSVDVTAKSGLTGKIAEQALDHAGITVNKNMIPFDLRKPMDPSGVRIGTPAVTSRGMKEAEMKQIGSWIARVLDAPQDVSVQDAVRGAVRDFCRQFPVPSDRQ
jgi:glycine hydroxymethyltransferase